MIAKVEENACAGCNVCIEARPEEAIKVEDVASVNAKLCVGCGACADASSNGAISVG